jgi:hypothetical protein
MKFEIRNSKLETSPKLEIGLLHRHLFVGNNPNVPASSSRVPLLADSIFEFASNFEFRNSNFTP